MFIEETCEQWLLTVIRTAQDQSEATYSEALAGVKALEVIGEREVTIETIGQYAKISPAIVLGILDNTVLNDLTDKGDRQFLSYELRVFLFVRDKFSHESRANNARPILRAIRNAFRGLRYTAADGATEGVARIKYTGQQVIGAINGVALYMMTFAIHSQDTNDTRRTL